MNRSLTTMMRLACTLVLFLSLLNEAGANVPSVSLIGSISDNLRAPGKLALGANGTLYVADAKKRGIVKFDVNGVYQGIIKVSGVVRSVAVAENRIIVSHDRAVTIFDASGAQVAELTGYGFQLPNGIATDLSGNIYVSDSKANKIAVFDRSGSFQRAFGAAGSEVGQLNFPTGLAYEKASGQIAVADTLNNRIQFFATDGSYKRVVGNPNSLSGPLSFTYPQGISFDYTSGVRMFVADAFQSSVQVIDLAAQPVFVTFIGQYGKADGQLQLPSDVLFDPRYNDLLVSDTSGRITFYGLDNAAAAAGAAQAGAQQGAVVASNGTNTAATGGNAAGLNYTGGVSRVIGGNGSSIVTSGNGAVSSSNNPPLSWQYPSGNDCSHVKSGAVNCQQK